LKTKTADWEDPTVVTFQDLPLHPDRDRAWDGDQAEANVREWAGGVPDLDQMDWDMYRQAFLVYDSDNPELIGSYAFNIADIVDGELRAIPRGIMTAGGVLEGAMGGTDLPENVQDRMRSHLDNYYQAMREEFDDDNLIAPWAENNPNGGKQFRAPFPWDSRTECFERMDGEVDDAWAFCNAWYHDPEFGIASAEKHLQKQDANWVVNTDFELDLPLADRDLPWDQSRFISSLRQWASGGVANPTREDIDWDQYRRAFLFYDQANPELFGSYKMGSAEPMNGQLHVLPRGVFTGASLLQGARGGAPTEATPAQIEQMQEIIGHYYQRMAEEFDDDRLIAPWERNENMENLNNLEKRFASLFQEGTKLSSLEDLDKKFQSLLNASAKKKDEPNDEQQIKLVEFTREIEDLDDEAVELIFDQIRGLWTREPLEFFEELGTILVGSLRAREIPPDPDDPFVQAIDGNPNTSDDDPLTLPEGFVPATPVMDPVIPPEFNIGQQVDVADPIMEGHDRGTIVEMFRGVSYRIDFGDGDDSHWYPDRFIRGNPETAQYADDENSDHRDEDEEENDHRDNEENEENNPLEAIQRQVIALDDDELPLLFGRLKATWQETPLDIVEEIAGVVLAEMIERDIEVDLDDPFVEQLVEMEQASKKVKKK